MQEEEIDLTLDAPTDADLESRGFEGGMPPAPAEPEPEVTEPTGKIVVVLKTNQFTYEERLLIVNSLSEWDASFDEGDGWFALTAKTIDLIPSWVLGREIKPAADTE